MEIRLDGLRPGKEAVVIAFYCPERLRCRLKDFGMVEGTVVRCQYRSPGADISALRLRGTTLAIRRTDLAQIVAKEV